MPAAELPLGLRVRAHGRRQGAGRRGRGPRHDDGADVAAFLQLQEEGVQLGCGGEGGEAEAGLGGVLEVGAGVREEDERHCLFFSFFFVVGSSEGWMGWGVGTRPWMVCLGVRRGREGWVFVGGSFRLFAG